MSLISQSDTIQTSILSPFGSGIDVSGYINPYNYRIFTTGLAPVAANPSGRVTLDFNSCAAQTVTLIGPTVISGSNYGLGTALTVRLFASGSGQALGWPSGWRFIGSTAPTGLATGKAAVLSVQSFDIFDSGVIAAYSVQP